MKTNGIWIRELGLFGHCIVMLLFAITNTMLAFSQDIKYKKVYSINEVIALDKNEPGIPITLCLRNTTITDQRLYRLKNLKCLSVGGCYWFNIPKGENLLSSLNQLEFIDSAIPKGLSRLKALRFISFHSMFNLKEMNEPLPQITHVVFSGSVLPLDMRGIFPNLEYLFLDFIDSSEQRINYPLGIKTVSISTDGFDALMMEKALPGMFRLSELEDLSIDSFPIDSLSNSFSQLKRLKIFRISYQDFLQNIPSQVWELTSLREIYIEKCPNLNMHAVMIEAERRGIKIIEVK